MKRWSLTHPLKKTYSTFLRTWDTKLKTQVGCSGYRIDLAIVDPLNDNKFLLGIECDGKAYHSSKVARDRDRLRQQVFGGAWLEKFIEFGHKNGSKKAQI
ncbi:hypothetical protein ACFTAO_37965 [Paenibacillus rhizoplanae]